MKLKWLYNWLNIRTDSQGENIMGSRIAFSNIIYMALPIVYAIFILIDYKSYIQSFDIQRFDQYIVPIVIGICYFCLWLNRIHCTISSRLIFIISWPMLLHIIPIYLLNTPSDYFIAFPLGIIFHSVLIQLMFSFKKEPSLFIGLITANCITTFFASDILVLFASDNNIIGQFKNDWYYFLDIFLYWLLFNMVTFYILFVVEKSINKLRESKSLIAEQKEELKMINEHLDELVAIKTDRLETQNKKLQEYAFYNSHTLRGPFCRIQGLVQLLELMDEVEIKREGIVERLRESTKELDLKIKEIQEIVMDEHEFVIPTTP